MSQDKSLVLLIGATGKCGYNTLKALLERGHSVRIITRSRDKAKKTLGDLFDQIDDVYECNLSLEAKALEKKIEDGFTKSIIEFAFQPSSSGQRVTHCIVTTGAIRTTPPEPAKYIDFLANVLIINLCKQYKIENFLFITAMGITKPYNLIVYFLNSIVDDTYHWKSKSEVYLRKSGLNYCIVRPGQLIGNIKDSFLHKFRITQGDSVMMDKNSGGTNVGTVGYLMVKLMEEQVHKKKVTFEITTPKTLLQEKQNSSQFFEEKSIPDLKQDDESHLKIYNHKTPRRNINVVLFSGIVLLFGYIFRNSIGL